MDFLNGPTAIQWSRLIISCATQDASPNELVNPKILEINRHRNTHSFGLVLPAICPGCVISSCVCIVLLFEQILRAMYKIPLRVSAANLLLRCAFGLVWLALIMKSVIFIITCVLPAKARRCAKHSPWGEPLPLACCILHVACACFLLPVALPRLALSCLNSSLSLTIW